MKTIIASFLIALCAFALFGCSDEPPKQPVKVEPVAKYTFQEIELNRRTAKENAVHNANVFRANSPLYGDWGLINFGDSTINFDCASGDGWATLELVSPDKKVREKIKCSTVSDSIGCLEDKQFKKKAKLSSEDGKCNPLLEHPIRKISG